MNQTAVSERNDTVLAELIGGMTVAMGSTLGAMIDRPVRVGCGESIHAVGTEEWLESIDGTKVVIRGTLEGTLRGRHVLFVFDLADAITLAGCIMLMSDEVIEGDRKAGRLERDHYEAFSEVANIVCSTAGIVLRRGLGPETGLRVRDFATIEPGQDPVGILGEGSALVCDFPVSIGDYAESFAQVIVDPETGDSWIQHGSTPADEPVSPQTPDRRKLSGRRTGDKPSAILGVAEPAVSSGPCTKLSAFVTNKDTAAMVRDCCRELGLELQRHAKTDIPNPAAHRKEIVLIEVPVGEDKRFDWTKRLKQHQSDIPVVLLIHQPSRPRVVQGLMSKANVILGWPSNASQLTEKIEPLIDPAPTKHNGPES